jgi:coatomer subunit beta
LIFLSLLAPHPQDNTENIATFGDGFALLVLELSRKVCRRDPAQKARFVRCLFQLLQSDSQAVQYEASWTLVSLSTAPTAVRACAQAYTTLLNTSNDNNVKLIVLDRLAELKKHHSKIVQEILMDILRALSSPNIHICKKTLNLAIDLVSPGNIEEVMLLLKREVIRAQETELEHGEEYKGLLISAIHKCATRFADVADSVLLVLLDFLAGESGYNVLVCVKSIIEQYPKFRSVIVSKIINNLDEVQYSRCVVYCFTSHRVLDSHIHHTSYHITPHLDSYIHHTETRPFIITGLNRRRHARRAVDPRRLRQDGSSITTQLQSNYNP